MRENRLREIMQRLGVYGLERSPSGWLHGRCPLAPWTHPSGTDAHPSFGVKVEDAGTSAYTCFSCKHHGRISGLVRTLRRFGADVGEVDGNGYPLLAHEADRADMEGIADAPFDREHVAEERPAPLEEAMFDGIFMPAWDVPDGRAYLEARGVGEGAARSMEMGWDPDQRRVVFPVRDGEGSLYGFTGRAVDPGVEPKIKDYHGLPKRWLLLGQHRWRGGDQDARPLVIVEGLFGYAHLVEMGLEAYADVAATMGSRLTEHQAAVVRVHDHPTYLLFDNDVAGDQALFGRASPSGDRDFHSGAVAALYEHVPVHVPAWPEEKDDPDQLTRREVWDMLRLTPRYGEAV